MAKVLHQPVGDIHARGGNAGDRQSDARLWQAIAGQEMAGWVGEAAACHRKAKSAIADRAGDPYAVTRPCAGTMDRLAGLHVA